MTLRVRLQYTLQSYDEGFVSVRLNQFRSTDSCLSRAGEDFLVLNGSGKDEVLIPIERGTHTLDATVVWPGDTGQGARAEVYGSGTVSLEASLWSKEPQHRFLTRYFSTEFCQRF